MIRPFSALIALFVFGAFASATQETSAGAPAPESETRFDSVPGFSFADSRGGTLSKTDLDGTPWIGVPFFLRCTGPCPSITRDIRERLYDRLDGTGIRIVSFSLDPERDTREALSAYADTLDIDRDRWLFVSAESEEAMHAFVKDGLKVAVQRGEDVTDPGLAITHGTRMPVIDGAGLIAGWYELADPALAQGVGASLDAEPILEGRYRAIANRARALGGYPVETPPNTSRIPLINASLNGLAFVLLLAGIVAIKGGRKKLHEHLMKLAFLASSVFLGFYLYYHFAVLPISGGPTKFNGTGLAKTLYLVMLASHVLLAIVNLPMVLRVLWLAHKEDWPRHKRLAKWTFPIWLYVSVTGVLVYLVLYPFNPPPA